MTAEAVKENVAGDDRGYCPRVEPEEHPHVILRPEVLDDPTHESAIQQSLVENVHDVRSEERPEERVQERHRRSPSSSSGHAATGVVRTCESVRDASVPS